MHLLYSDVRPNSSSTTIAKLRAIIITTIEAHKTKNKDLETKTITNYSTTNVTNTNYYYTMGISIVGYKEVKEEVVMTSPPAAAPQKIDLLDLLDRKTRVPKDLKTSKRPSITLLDIMDPPASVLKKDADKKETFKQEEAMDLLELLDGTTRLPKKEVGAETVRRRKGLLDVMEPPAVVEEKEVIKSMDLVDFLDSKTRLPKKDIGEETVRRRIGLLDVMDAPTPSISDKAKDAPVDLVDMLDPKTRLPRNSRGLPGRRKVNILDILESGENNA